MYNKLQKRSEQVPEDREGGDGRGDGLQGGHACHSHRLKMMGVMGHQPTIRINVVTTPQEAKELAAAILNQNILNWTVSDLTIL